MSTLKRFMDATDAMSLAITMGVAMITWPRAPVSSSDQSGSKRLYKRVVGLLCQSCFSENLTH